MKIYITAVPTANIDDVYLTLEGKNRDLKAIAAICDRIQFIEETAGATYGIFIDIAMAVQGVGSAAGALTFTTLADDGKYVYNSIADTTISMFQKGKQYLIPISAKAVVRMTPTIPSSTIPTLAGTKESVWCSTHYHFMCLEDVSPLGATSVSVYTFQIGA